MWSATLCILLYVAVFFVQFSDGDNILDLGPINKYYKPLVSNTCSAVRKTRYLLYDINFVEGFNLRRDVYMRMASLVKQVNAEDDTTDWVLVLPPWGPLYHWQSLRLGFQSHLAWSRFFNLQALMRYTPVIELTHYLNLIGPKIDMIYYLQHPPNMGVDGNWEETMKEEECSESPFYVKTGKKYKGWFWGYDYMYAGDLKCLSVLGTSSTLKSLLLKTNYTSLMFDRAEVVLHDAFGDVNYWMIRRSMRFSSQLMYYSDLFRREHLNSTNGEDRTIYGDNWMEYITKNRPAVGGPYLAVHMRRKDFVKVRPTQVPSINYAAEQIKKKMAELKLTMVFIATDAPDFEFRRLKHLIPSAVRFKPKKNVLTELKDGGVAIVDQLICAHARYFIGTHESTFSYRIQEEREILGFPPNTTFNRLCGDKEKDCKQPSQWLIAYPDYRRS